MWLPLERGRGIGLGRLPEPFALFLVTGLSIASQAIDRWDHLAAHMGLACVLLLLNWRIPFPRLFLISVVMTGVPIFLGNAIAPDAADMPWVDPGQRALFFTLRRIATLFYGFAWLFSTTPARAAQAFHTMLRPFSPKLALTWTIVTALFPRLVRTFREYRVSLGLRLRQQAWQRTHRGFLARLSHLGGLFQTITRLRLMLVATAVRMFAFIPEVVAGLQSYGPVQRQGALGQLQELTLDPPHISGSVGQVDAPRPTSLHRGAMLLVQATESRTTSTYLEFAARIIPAVEGDASSGFKWNGEDLIATGISLAPSQGRIAYHAPSWGHCSLGVTLRQHGRLAGLPSPLLIERAQRWHVDHLLDRELQTLSGGQQLRAYLCVALATPRELMILNAPLDQLDVEAAPLFVEDLASMREHAPGIVVISDPSDRVAASAMEREILAVSAGAGDAAQSLALPRVQRASDSALHKPITTVAIPGRNLRLRCNPPLELRAGMLGVLHGPNGVGKTSLFEAIAGIQPSDLGPVAPGRIGYIMQAPRANAVALTVRDELAIAADRASFNPAISTVIEALRAALDPVLDRPIAELGTYVLRLLALATMAQGATVLLCDEPDIYLSRSEAVHVEGALRALADAGLAVLVATHTSSLLAGADTVINIEDASR